MMRRDIMRLNDKYLDHCFNMRDVFENSRKELFSHEEEDEFFEDLPKPFSLKDKPMDTDDKENTAPKYRSYSYSSTSYVDENGHRVSASHRDYEDSTGRSKRVLERNIDGKKLKEVWNRTKKDEKLAQKVLCSDGSVEDFEKAWKDVGIRNTNTKKSRKAALKAKAEEAEETTHDE
jgi:hypothetical protein